MHRNGVKTAALLGSLSAVAVVVGSRFGSTGVWVAVAGSTLVGGYVYLRGDAMALRAMRAYPVGEAEQPTLYRLVRELSTRARTPMPRVYVSPTRAVNAFAAGRSPEHAVICCTEGMLDLLDEAQLRSVVAHELAHIRHRDILVSSVAGALAAIVMMAAGLSILLPGGEDEDGPGLVSGLLLAVLGPVAAGVIALAVNRSREFDADAAAARITGDPLAMAGALRAIDASTRRLALPPERGIIASSHLMIANPVQRSGLARWFSSHPPMSERIARLEQLAGYRR